MADYAIPMPERFRHSLDPQVNVPSVSYIDPRNSRSLGYEYSRNQEFCAERPNLVISGTRRLSRTNFTVRRSARAEDEYANALVEKLEENEELMDDTPHSEQLRKEALRDLPECLTMKRQVKQKLTKSVSQRSERKPIGFWKRMKYRININYSKFVGSLKNFNYFELWHGRLKDIEGHFGSGYASYFKFLRWLFVMNFCIAVVSFVFLVLPQIVYDFHRTYSNPRPFEFKNIFIGNGFFVDTVLYYGHYTNATIELVPSTFFDVPVAYFTVNAILYLISFLILGLSVAKMYRRTFIETEGGFQNVYANRIFCGWDYAIATEEAAELKSSSIFHELRELLTEDFKDHEEWSCLYKFWTYTIQVVVNIFVLLILGAVGWLTWVLLERFSDENDSSAVTAIVVNVIIMVFPTIFNYISKYEDYRNPRTSLYITLVRTYLLGSVIIGAILVFWLKKGSDDTCWETFLGAEIYRLIIYDFIFSVIGSSIINAGYFLGRYCCKRNPKSDFNVAKHTLQIIYNQGLFWVGFFYLPILPIIVTIKMFIIWYVMELNVKKFCRPPKRTWRAAQTQTWFMMMTFVAILLIIAAQGYTLNSVPASSICGPFRDYKYTYEILTNNLATLSDNGVWAVILSVTKPGGVAILMIALGIWVYYVKEQANATRAKVKMLKETLASLTSKKKEALHNYYKLNKPEINLHGFGQPVRVLPSSAEFAQNFPRNSLVGDKGLHARFRTYSDANSVSEDELNARFRTSNAASVSQDELNSRFRTTSDTSVSEDDINARFKKHS